MAKFTDARFLRNNSVTCDANHMKFETLTQVPVGATKFDQNRCNESPLRGEKPDFWPVSKNNTGSLPLRGNPAGNWKQKHRAIKENEYRQDVVSLYQERC